MIFALCLLVDGVPVFSDAHAMEAEQVTCYPTYGYKEGDAWVIPMRVWVRERREITEKLLTRIAKGLGELEPGEIVNFSARIRDFVADDESREAVSVTFDNDPDRQEFRIENGPGNFPKTDLNGLIEGVIHVPQDKASQLLAGQGSQNGWLSLRAASKRGSGTGRVRLIEPAGLSVISDIDDTVKVTQIPAGAKVVIRNTFFRDFRSAPGMAALYQGWSGASFHYVSGSPWQMYAPLSEFLFSPQAGFPEGSFHMRNARKNLLSAHTWEDLSELVTNEDLTYEQKLAQISQILMRFPQRRFILVGDSGEKDPEVYREIKARFPDQVREIIIRDVVDTRQNDPARLEGMTVIQAPTVTTQVSSDHDRESK